VTGSDRYRVVQWATGNIGSHSLRGVIAHPNLDLVGLYVYSEDKEGRDAGELCGVAVLPLDDLVVVPGPRGMRCAEQRDKQNQPASKSDTDFLKCAHGVSPRNNGSRYAQGAW